MNPPHPSCDICARESACAIVRTITAAKKRLQNLLYKPIILNSEPHSAQTLQQQLLLLLLLALRQHRTRDAHKISPHGTMTKRQLGTGTTRSAGVGGFGLALAILVGLGRVGRWVGLANLLLLLLALRQNRTRDAHKISPHDTMTERQL